LLLFLLWYREMVCHKLEKAIVAKEARRHKNPQYITIRDAHSFMYCMNNGQF
jgi:hypothetical protein